MSISKKVFLLFVVLLSLAGRLFAADLRVEPWTQTGFEAIDKKLSHPLLSDEQKKKLDDLKNAYAPKFQAAVEKAFGNLSTEQKNAAIDAYRKAVKAKKNSKAAYEARNAAMNLTDDQKKTAKAGKKELRLLQKGYFDKAMAILTPEQREQINAQPTPVKTEKASQKKEK